jgi:hypothetical protein
MFAEFYQFFHYIHSGGAKTLKNRKTWQFFGGFGVVISGKISKTDN